MLELTWEGKKKSFYEAIQDTDKKLQLVAEKSINPETTDNIYIEGDNLDALKILKNDYLGKIKFIYIDPPYNTGKKLMYNDDFSQKTQQHSNDTIWLAKPKKDKHTQWCNMLYPRLILARSLLSDDGVIFISINKTELAQLKLMCDEIFGEDNSQIFVWNHKNAPSGTSTGTRKIDNKHEYILCYQKDSSTNPFKLSNYKDNEAQCKGYILRDEYFNERGHYKLTPLHRYCTDVSFKYQPWLDYEIEAPDGTIFKNYLNIIKPNSVCYTWSKKLFEFGLENGFIEFKKHKDGYWQVYRKNYERVGLDTRNLQVIQRDAGTAYGNLLLGIPSTIAATDLSKLGLHNCFTNSKPVKLIKHLLEIASSPDDIVLDFFSGSSTTAHAVMQLNNEDNGNRKFILVQIPEECAAETVAYNSGFKNICELGLERIRRVRNQIDNKELDTGLKYYKIV